MECPSDLPPPPPSTASADKLPESKPKKKKKITSSSQANMKAERKKSLPNKLYFREKQIWADFIKKHREDLKKATPVVDDKPPKLKIGNLYDVDDLKNAQQILRMGFDTNQSIIKSLHEVNVGRGRTDTFSYKYGRPQASNYQDRREDAKAIEAHNVFISMAIKNPQTTMKTAKDYAEEWKRHEEIIENSSQFPLFWKVKKKKKKEEAALEMGAPVPYFRQYVTEKSAKYPDKRPRVFLEVSIENVGVVGKMIVMLYSEYVPMTVKNFLAFCDPKATLTYKGNYFYLIFQNYYCQTGDVVENRGYGGTSIYGPYFSNEDFTVKHGERGMLTMFNKIPNRNESQFLITFRKLESLDGQNVAFGKVIKGFHVIDAIESVGSKKTGRPKVKIYISDCDEI